MEAVEAEDSIEVTAWSRVTTRPGETCTTELRFEGVPHELEAPLGDRKLVPGPLTPPYTYEEDWFDGLEPAPATPPSDHPSPRGM